MTKYWTVLVTASLATLLTAFFPLPVAHADIFEWEYINPANPSLGKQQSTTLTPNGAGANAVPGANLSNRNLTMAYLIGANLSSVYECDENGCYFVNYPANLSGANLTQADLTGANLTLVNLTGTNFTGSVVRGATLSFITAVQLYSTASYQAHDLTGINLNGTVMTGANFAGQYLTNADFTYATLTNANFNQAQLEGAIFRYADLTGANLTGAEVRGASFVNFQGSGITATQLYSTTSYQAHDLTGIVLVGNNLAGFNLAGQNLTNARFEYATLTNANFSQANLTNASLSSANLTGAILTGAEVRGANFTSYNDPGGISGAQLYSTASYQAHDLTGIGLNGIDLTGGNLAGQNLTNAKFISAKLTNANLSHANLTGATFDGTLTGANFTGADVRGANFSSGFTAAQLYSTASYQAHDLTGIRLYREFAGVNLAGQNLTNATLGATLTNADLSQANLTNAIFTGFGFAANLTGANLSQANLTNAYLAGYVSCGEGACEASPGADLTNTNLSGANLTNADFSYVPLTGTNLTDANVRGAKFTGSSITAAQLQSTANYQAHDLTGIKLQFTNLSGVNLVGLNLTGVDFYSATLTGANLSQANLTNASFFAATLTGANFTNAEVRRANFFRDDVYYGGTGISTSQLYSTASYQAHDLSGIDFYGNNLDGVNLAGQNLTNADFRGTTLTGASLAGADARGVFFDYNPFTSANTSNLIQSYGHIAGLDLTAGASLVVRDYDGDVAFAAVVVDEHLAMNTTGTLRLVFDADAWDSTISFAPGIPVALGGTLDLTFAPNINIATQSGRTIDLFNWTGVTPSGTFTVSSPYTWNLSKLYTTGEVTLGPQLAGDYSGNGTVGPEDYNLWKANFGSMENLAADGNGDGRVNAADYTVWRNNLGATHGSGSGAALPSAAPLSAAVPEPATLALAGLSLLGLIACSRPNRSEVN